MQKVQGINSKEMTGFCFNFLISVLPCIFVTYKSNNGPSKNYSFICNIFLYFQL